MIHRIKQIMSLEELSASQFADEIDIQRSSLSHVLSGRNKPSLDFIMKIKKSFNRISLDWLIFGDGQMFIDGLNEVSQLESTKDIADMGNSEPELLKFKENIFDSNTVESHSSEKEVIGERVDMVYDEKPLSYGKTTSKVVIFYSNGTFEEFRKV